MRNRPSMDGMPGAAVRAAAWTAAALGLVLVAPARAADVQRTAGDVLLGMLALVVSAAAIGVGIGALGLVTNHVFRGRAAMGYRVMRARPLLSLLLGVLVTLAGMGLVRLCEPVPLLQLIVLMAYLLGLGTFAAGASARLAGRILEPSLLDDELPGAAAHVKGGLLLVFMNGVPFVGSVVFIGILLAGFGSALVAYFASMGRSAAAIASDPSSSSRE